MSEFELKYVGPGPEALEVNQQPVPLGGTVTVDEAEAARLLANGAWEHVGGVKRKPKAPEAGEEVALAVPAGDVHEGAEDGEEEATVAASPDDDGPPAGGTDEG